QNRGHVARAQRAKAGRLSLLVTQSVDGLHERSGFPRDRLVEIHGTDSAVECMACHERAPREVAQAAWEAGTAVPRCDCGGPWKTATISFGQGPLPGDLPRALAEGAARAPFAPAGPPRAVRPREPVVPRRRPAR